MAKKITEEELYALIECFQSVEDPRVQGRSRHLLIDIIFITICGLLCGVESVAEFTEFALMKEEWLRRYIELPSGIPSHDTFARVLSLINPEQLELAFFSWVQSIAPSAKIKSISIDGKSVAGTARRYEERFSQLHTVSVYCHELDLTIAQTQAKNRGLGESGAILTCLDLLDLKGVTVLGDGALSQEAVVTKIVAEKGFYVLPIKQNQSISLDELESKFAGAKKREIKTASVAETGHGRVETRSCQIYSGQMSDAFTARWRDFKTVLSVTRKRSTPDVRPPHLRKPIDGVLDEIIEDKAMRTTIETTYYVSNRALTPTEALNEVRKHWAIENNLHWSLDVAFREDDWTVRATSLARTLSLLRKTARNIVKNSETKGSVRMRMKRAGWNNDFLDQLLFGKK